MKDLMKVGLIILIVGAVLFIIFVITMLGIFSTPPTKLKVYYYDFSSGKEKEISLKKVSGGIGTNDHEGDINLDTSFFDVVRYAYYEDFSFPKQEYDDWTMLGYVRYSSFDQYGSSEQNLFNCSFSYKRGKAGSRYCHYGAILEKDISTVKIVDGNNENLISYSQRILVKSNGEVSKAELKLEDSFQKQIKNMFDGDISFGGIYDEQDGGICIVNENFEVLADASKILDKTLYVHKKQFELNIQDVYGNVITKLLKIGDRMPDLSIEIPNGYNLVGWKIVGTDKLISAGNEYIKEYNVFSQNIYIDYINDSKISICPILQHNNVDILLDDVIIQCKYGEYLSYVPESNDEHMIFCGWSYANGQLFDGFALDNIALFSIWNGKNYKFNFNLNGGACEKDLSNIYYKYGSQIIALPNAITKEGYEFIGWFSSPDEDAVQYCNAVGVLISGYEVFMEEKYTLKDNVVNLYAHYKETGKQ